MSNQWLIIVAIGEKGVRYGKNCSYLRPIVELLHSSDADSWSLTRQGAVVYFLQSQRAFKRIESFFAQLETLRNAIPQIGIGLAREIVHCRFNWFGLVKQEIENNYELENQALERAQGPQSYRQTLEYIEAESGFGPMLKVWR